MFATIRRYQGKPGQTAETVSRVKAGLIPTLSKQPGFRSYHAVEAADDVAVSVSLYESRAAAEAANQAVASWVKDNLADNVGPAEVTVGEVVASSTAAPEDQNVELVKNGYDAFGRDDLPGLLSLLDAAVGEFFQTLASIGDILRFEPKEFIAQGDRVVVIGDDTTLVKATGKSVEFRWVHVFQIRNGKVWAFEEMGDVSALVAEIRSGQAQV
jgi:ketosteroid isomerase-like protein/heme-degrading monooxygenase HmoA